MRRSAWWLIAAGAYAFFLFARFPAATAYRWFAPDALRLQGIEGTLWSGRAALGSVAGLPLHELGWSLNPLPLFIGRVALRVETRVADGFLNSSVSLSPFAVRLADLQASVSLPAIDNLLPPALQSTRGIVSADLQALELRQGWIADAAGDLSVARLAAPPLLSGPGGSALIALGDYRASFAPTGGEGLRGELRDLGGPLEVDGSLVLEVDGNYTLEGFVRARPEASRELVQGLDLMTGDPDASGRRAFDFRGSFAPR